MEMGRRVPLRLTPEYRFEYDDSLEEAELVSNSYLWTCLKPTQITMLGCWNTMAGWTRQNWPVSE
jgi:hypothetical protein